MNDPGGMQELQSLGIAQLPVVRNGDRTVTGFDLDAIADLVGTARTEHAMLSPEELFGKLEAILAAAQRAIAAFPSDKLKMTVPRREQRDVRELGYHIFRIPIDFIDALAGAEYRAGTQPVPDAVQTPDEIAAFGEDARRRIARWFPTQTAASWETTFETSYGTHSRHRYLERTAWHSGQHLRQLHAMLESAGLAVEPLSGALFAGLPMPERLWE